MSKRVRRDLKQRLETRYRIASEDQGIKDILILMKEGSKLSDSQKAYALARFRMVKRAMALTRMPFVVERICGSFFYKPGPPYPMSEKARERLSLPPIETQIPVATGLLRKSPAQRVSRLRASIDEHTTPTQSGIDAFYASWDWARLRYRILQKKARTCMCCGATATDGAKIHVDHIKPIRRFWHLRLDPDNLQVLCEPCNMGKGSWDETDFRPSAEGRPAWVN